MRHKFVLSQQQLSTRYQLDQQITAGNGRITTAVMWAYVCRPNRNTIDKYGCSHISLIGKNAEQLIWV